MGALDTLGQEVTGIVAPVSICMALTVFLVRVLNPNGDSDTSALLIASAYYAEKADDSTGTKLAGSVINALIFVVIVGLMTFVLVLLFKYGCVRFIYGYMGFAGFSIFFFLTGVIALQLIKKASLRLDAFSFIYILFNFAVVGVGSVFFWPAPVLLKQGYLVVTGVVTAYMFTFIPEWTTWTLLIAMALYDLYAVLTPGGPLKVLVELAIERDQDIPALIYEGRSTAYTTSEEEGGTAQGHAEEGLRQAGKVLDGLVSDGDRKDADASENGAPVGSSNEEAAGDAASSSAAASASQGASVPLPLPTAPLDPQRHASAHGRESEEDELWGLPDSIKLGLGDFIFYSVLVGRAAMYDMLTVFAAYLAIVAGLGMTLLLLAVAQKALPALPISIALGISFYFTTRELLEPFILPLSTNLLFF
ncbi:hypothetical protein WJX75_004245 [Coccomyxa subellipsoidea]|uniref:Presenilin n=1 Tax=Coccomyxa subellipsoidea TaxID=248742 RepID=A0ABR2YT82_9CHLO